VLNKILYVADKSDIPL